MKKFMFVCTLMFIGCLFSQSNDIAYYDSVKSYEEYNMTYFKSLDEKEFVFKIIPKAELEYFFGEGDFKRFCTPKDTADYKLGTLKTRVGLDFNFGPFTLYFDNHIYMNPSKKGFTFSPTRVDFYSGLNIDISKNIKVKFEHLCVHPISSYDNPVDIKMFGGYNSIKISYGY